MRQITMRGIPTPPRRFGILIVFLCALLVPTAGFGQDYVVAFIDTVEIIRGADNGNPNEITISTVASSGGFTKTAGFPGTGFFFARKGESLFAELEPRFDPGVPSNALPPNLPGSATPWGIPVFSLPLSEMGPTLGIDVILTDIDKPCGCRKRLEKFGWSHTIVGTALGVVGTAIGEPYTAGAGQTGILVGEIIRRFNQENCSADTLYAGSFERQIYRSEGDTWRSALPVSFGTSSVVMKEGVKGDARVTGRIELVSLPDRVPDELGARLSSVKVLDVLEERRRDNKSDLWLDIRVAGGFDRMRTLDPIKELRIPGSEGEVRKMKKEEEWDVARVLYNSRSDGSFDGEGQLLGPFLYVEIEAWERDNCDLRVGYNDKVGIVNALWLMDDLVPVLGERPYHRFQSIRRGKRHMPKDPADPRAREAMRIWLAPKGGYDIEFNFDIWSNWSLEDDDNLI